MGKSSHGQKTDRETQSPMLRIFKEIMQREKNDPEKSSQSKEKRKTKKKRYFSSQSKSELKSPASSYVDEKNLKQQYIVQEAARDYRVHQARTSFCGSDKAGGSKQSDDTCSISCALKRLLSNEYACVGCLLFVFTITVITVFVLVFQAMPLVPDTGEERFLRNLGTKPMKRESDNFKFKIDALSKSIKDQKRSVWENTLSNHMDKFSSSDVRDLSFGSLASLSDPEPGPSAALAEVLDSSQVKSGDSSERLRDFYTKLLKTDEQIKHLKKGTQAITPDILKMFTLNPYYRLKRQAQFRNIFSKKRQKEIVLKEDIAEKHDTGGKANDGKINNKKINSDKKNSSNDKNKHKRAKIMHADSEKTENFKHTKDRVRNVEIIRHRRFDNASNQMPSGIIIENKKILLQYLPNETSKIVKCSHTPKESNSHEHQRKHPFYKNTERLDELLDKVFDKNIKDIVGDPFGMNSVFEKNKYYDKVTTAPLKAYQYAEDVTKNVYNQYVKPNVNKAKQLKSDLMKMIQEDKGKEITVKPVAKEHSNAGANNKHNPRMMERNEDGAIRMERNEATTVPMFDVMLSISTVINSPDARIYPDNADNTLSFSGRKLLQSEEEDEEIQYEDLKEVLSDDKDSHDEIEREVDRRKRAGIDVNRNEEDPVLTQAPTKYNNPPGVQNPNWKGPMPLYPDELSAMMTKVENPDVKKNLPGVPVSDEDVSLDTLEAELHELSNLQLYPEPKQSKMAQAYSDYGVLTEKKDAIKNEKTVEKIYKNSLKLEANHPKKSILRKRKIFGGKRKIPGFTRSKDEKEGFSVNFERTKPATVVSTSSKAQTTGVADPLSAAAEQLQLHDGDNSGQKDENKRIKEKYERVRSKHEAIRDKDRGIKDDGKRIGDEKEGFMFAVGFPEPATAMTNIPSCWNNVSSEKFRENCKCGHAYPGSKCCCQKEGQYKQEMNKDDLIYCCDFEEEGLKIELKSKDGYPTARLLVTENNPEETCFCWKTNDVKTPQIELLQLLNIGNSSSGNNNDETFSLMNYKYMNDNDIHKVDDEYDKNIKVNILNNTPSQALTTSTTLITNTETPLHIGSSEKEGLKFELRPSIKKPEEIHGTNSVAHSLSKFIRLTPEKYTHNSLSHFTTLVPMPTTEYELLYTKGKSQNKLKSKKKEKHSWKMDQSGDEEFSISDNNNMRSLKSVKFDIDNEKDEILNIDEQAMVDDENKKYFLRSKDEVSNIRVKRNAQPFDAEIDIKNDDHEPLTIINTKEHNISGVVNSKTTYINTTNSIEPHNITIENASNGSNIENDVPVASKKENVVSNETNKDNLNNLNVLPMANNTGMVSADFFMDLANWFGAMAGYGTDVTPMEENNSSMSPNVISFVKQPSKPKPSTVKSIKKAQDVMYPMYDADMVDNIGHRSRVLLSIEEDNHNKSMLATKQLGNKNSEFKDETTTMVLIKAKNEDVSTKVEANQTQNQRLETNKTLVKRSVPKQNSLIFWNEIYDDEYGVQDPMDKSEDKTNKHSAISSGDKRNVMDKSAKWFGDKMKRIRNSIRTKANDKKDKVKTRLNRDVNSFGVYADPTVQYNNLLKNAAKPTREEMDPRENTIDFAALTANMKEVCKQAAEAVQQTRNLVVRQDDNESSATTGLMQQLVKLMSDLVDYQVKQKTCLRLPSDLKEFLEWLTLPTTIAEHRKNLKVIPPDHDTDRTQAVDLMSTQVASSEREERPDSRSECLGTIHAVKELMQQYTDLSEEDKSKMTGVKEYLQGQLDFLNKRLESLSEVDLSKTKEAPYRYKRYMPHENYQKYRLKKSLQEQSNQKHRYLKHGKKHTRTTPNIFDGSTDSQKKDSILIDAKFIENKMADQYEGQNDAKDNENKMADQYGGQINEESNSRDVKRNLKDVYYKALSDAKKFTTVKSIVHRKDAGSEDVQKK